MFRKLFRISVSVLWLAVIVLAPGVLFAVDPTIADEIDELMASQTSFNGVLLVAVDGEIIFHDAYGLANREFSVPNTVDTRFAIASLTKQFLGMAALRLQEEGLLDVNDLACDYLDDCPDAWADITILHLLTHQSGIPEYVVGETGINEDVLMMTADEVKMLLLDKSLKFEPGTQFEYSDSGYVVLADVISQAADQDFKLYVTLMLRDLGLDNTRFMTNLVVMDQLADRYTSPSSRAVSINPDAIAAPGGLYSTAEDLFRWNQMLYNGDVVAASSWDTMWENAAQMPNGFEYGYGLIRLPFPPLNNDFAVAHNGALPGGASMNSHFVENNIDIIMLSNLPNPMVDSMLNAVHQILIEHADSLH